MNNLLTVEYPAALPDSLHMSRTEFEREARLAMGVKLFETGKLTSAQAARIAGLHKVQFLSELSRFGVASIQIGADELEHDLAVAQAAHDRRQ
jgi:predicted HTH domain antitoxin